LEQPFSFSGNEYQFGSLAKSGDLAKILVNSDDENPKDSNFYRTIIFVELFDPEGVESHLSIRNFYKNMISSRSQKKLNINRINKQFAPWSFVFTG